MLRHLSIFLLVSLTALDAKPPLASKNTPASIPSTGKLGENELTLLAIAHRHELEKLRGAVKTAAAKKRAAHDLENPELRLSLANDGDDRVNNTKPNPAATTDRDRTWGMLFRFSLPNPWERSARIRSAAAQVNLSDTEYHAAEDLLVRQVHGACQEIAILTGKLSTQARRKAGFEAYRDWLENQKNPKLGLDLASARVKAYNTLSDIRSLESELASKRQNLASLCGLTDASRIDTLIQTRRIENPASLDLDYLTSLAMLYRRDVLGNQARLAIAQAELSKAKATRVPVATFVDVGYSQMETQRSTGQKDEVFARVGVSIPLFDWFGFNKEYTVHEEASRTLETQLKMQSLSISNEIRQAIKNLANAESQLSQQDKDLSNLNADLKKSMTDAQLATLDADDLVSSARIEQEFKDLAQQMELSRYSGLAAYQEALMALEIAIGVRLERALNPSAGP